MSKTPPFPMYHDIPWVLRFGIPTIGIISGFMSLIILGLSFSDKIISIEHLKLTLWISGTIVTGSIILSYLVPKQIIRIRHFYLLVGLMTSMVLATCLICSVIYFLAKKDGFFLTVITIIGFSAWLIQIYLAAIKRVKNKRLIEKNYIEKENIFELKRPINEFNGNVTLNLSQQITTNWIYTFIAIGSFYEFISTDFKSYLPIDLFKYWFIGSLGLVLSAYAAARLVQGFYLWFYIIWKLERKTGKKFLFPEPDQAPSN
ncbi:MAG: hypothetical protein KJ798_08565 [Gammaproteobacteria bacterium]|nr:hypothetical protein [Gammaproteobacteria bacterium]MBU0848365.1 hypothetical protein [Gammaproteobacteria bacterium]MBU1268782.1 hypothetical protein [Gammaproteobacteria bacterium]MBU1780426.1 hypothetical protein [Gammaproteobacteria bacterium]MBU2088036.1 hypothetical protein [Gammaproteobacteria bacterium]